MVLFLMVLLLIALAVAAPKVAISIQRDREIELVHRGEQYKRAIKMYYKKFGAYPSSIDQLMNTNQVRFLRKRYTDPITGKNDWRLIYMGQAKVPPMGFFGQPLTGLSGPTNVGTPVSGLAGGSATGTPPYGSSNSGSSGFGSTSPGSSGFGSSDSASGSAQLVGVLRVRLFYSAHLDSAQPRRGRRRLARPTPEPLLLPMIRDQPSAHPAQTRAQGPLQEPKRGRAERREAGLAEAGSAERVPPGLDRVPTARVRAQFLAGDRLWALASPIPRPRSSSTRSKSITTNGSLSTIRWKTRCRLEASSAVRRRT